MNKRKPCSYIMERRECSHLVVTMDTRCKVYLKRDNTLQLRSSNSHVDCQLPCSTLKRKRLVGLVVKASTSRAEDPPGSFTVTASLAMWLSHPPRKRKVRGSNPACVGIFPGSSHTSDFKIGTPVATLPVAWRYRVSTGTGRPGVSIP